MELLAPAGDLIKLKMAILYGADAVYLGGEEFSLRVAAENFSLDDMKEGIKFAHEKNKKVYLTLNIIPHSRELPRVREFVEKIKDFGFDGVIVADLGVCMIINEIASQIAIHVSTQANNVNQESIKIWHRLGAKRIVLARELTLDEIKEIRENIPPEIELEAFVHGAMCISYSGRCLLSHYMTNRDANMGECAQSCRWKYYLMEEKRPGEFFPIEENSRGTFIFNSKDLCMIEHIKELHEAGVVSLKIEGRIKSEFYVATVIKAYRDAIDDFYAGKPFDPKNFEEVSKVSHREYCKGFYFGMGKEGAQVYGTASYVRGYDFIGLVKDYDEETKIATIEQRNKFAIGTEIEIMQPGKPNFVQIVDKMKNAEGEEIEVAPHPQMTLYIKMEKPVCKDAIVRKKVEE